ncbi:hypothetical protein GQ457_02G027630 [Hibiscus cannabinus]
MQFTFEEGVQMRKDTGMEVETGNMLILLKIGNPLSSSSFLYGRKIVLVVEVIVEQRWHVGKLDTDFIKFSTFENKSKLNRYSFLELALSNTDHLPIMAALSDDLVQEWIHTEGKATQITRIRFVGGGCINLASCYETDVEAIGLDAMYETRTIHVLKLLETT